MIFNGINFNEAHWKTKTESEFIAHESHHDLSKEQLKEAYALMTKKLVNHQPVDTGTAGKTAD